DYAAIYGSSAKDNGTQTRYCKITAYDGAKRYPVEGESTADDELGNSTSTYYLRDDIYTDILANYTTNDIYKMLNNNYLLLGENRSANTVESIITQLGQKKVSGSNFSLNPENNPIFFVNGKDSLPAGGDLTSGNYDITNGSSVVVEVTTGLDNIPLNADTLRPYLLPCNASGVASLEDTEDNRIYLCAANDETVRTKSGSSYKFTLALDSTKTYDNGKTISIGNTYLFAVAGSDTNGNTIMAKENSYGFILKSNGSAPALTVTSPSSTIAYVNANGSQVFSGSVICQEGRPTVTITGTKLDNSSDTVTCTLSEATIVNGLLKYTFTGTKSFSASDTNDQIQYSIVAEQSGLKTTVNKTLIYDKDAPDVNVGSLLPIATKYYTDKEDDVYSTVTYNEQSPYTEDNYLNGTVTLKVSINDEYDSVNTEDADKKAYLEVVEVSDSNVESVLSIQLASGSDVTSENAATAKHYITKLINGQFIIDTTQIASGETEKKIRFKVHAWDRAGNAKVYTYPEENNTFKVNQQTDKPVILPASRDLSLTYETKEARDNAQSRKSQIPSGGQLLLTAIDDDGIDSYKIYRVDYSNVCSTVSQAASAMNSLNVTSIEGNGSTQLPISESGPTLAGYYWYKVVVKDITNTESEIGPFIIKATTAAPRLISLTANESNNSDAAVGLYVGSTEAGSSKTKWENTITIDGSESPFYLYRKEVAFEEDFTPNSQNPQVGQNDLVCTENSTSIIDTISSPTTNKTYYYRVYDSNWNPSNDLSITRKIDKTAPNTLTISKPEVNAYSSGSSDTLTGELRDADAPSTNEIKSGISKLYYKISTSDSTPTEWTEQTTSDGRWNINVDMGDNGLAEGKYWLHMKAEDAAGNTITSSPRAFFIDQSIPSLSKTTTSTYYKNGDTASVTFTATDTNELPTSSISLTIKKNGTEISANDYATNGITLAAGSLSDDKKTFTQVLSFTSDGSHDGSYEVTAEAVDAAGRRSSSLSFTSIIDGTSPLFTASSLKVGNAAPSSSFYKSNTQKISGTYTEDMSGMDTLYYYVKNPSSSDPVPTDLSASGAASGEVVFRSGSNNFDFTLDNLESNTNNTGTSIYFQAKDLAGNLSTQSNLTLNIDTSAPVLNTKYYKVGSGSLKTAGGTVYVNGSAQITVYGNYKDEESGVNALTFKVGDTDITPTVNYSTSVINEEADTTSATWSAYDDITNKQSIRSWKAAHTITSNGKFTINGSNTANSTSSEEPFTVTIDATVPSLKNIRLLTDVTNDVDAYKKTVTENGVSEDQYYINNTSSTALTLSGVATDNIGVDTVSLVITDASNGTHNNYQNSGTSSEWKFEGIDMSTWSSNANGRDAQATIKVTDVAGNESTTNLNIYFDTTSPAGKHEIDSSSKDIYFRIGDNDNDDINSSSTNPQWNDALDTDVGGKYTNNTYGNASTITIRGKIDDADSGVKMIYYTVFDKPIALG
ncbi:MAG: hypothetical protein K6C97_08770, partial [Treponema sp.]|nr:hypothetical protein [Treponema sp.]